MPLDAYSSKVLAAVLVAFPEFRAHVAESSEDGSFSIELDAPSGSHFWVTSRGREVTVGFDAHHAHFGDPSDPDLDPSTDAATAIRYIRSLMSGEIGVEVWTRGGQLILSSSYRGADADAGRKGCLGRWWLRGAVRETKGWRGPLN